MDLLVGAALAAILATIDVSADFFRQVPFGNIQAALATNNYDIIENSEGVSEGYLPEKIFPGKDRESRLSPNPADSPK